jgi:vesicle transport protein SEC22
LVICDRAYPKKLAFSYLEELHKEFQALYANESLTVARPYAFVKFDSFIQKTKKQYRDTRNHRKLNDDLGDVTKIMSRNIQDVLGRGEQLDRICSNSGMQNMSSNLSAQSKNYLKDTKKLNWDAFYQKYGPPVIVLTIVSVAFYFRYLFH